MPSFRCGDSRSFTSASLCCAWAVAGAIGIVLAYLGWGSVGLLVGLVVGNLCISLPNALTVWRVVRVKLLERPLFAELAAYGLPFAMTGALGAFISLSDRYIIEVLIGTEATGLYAASYDLVMRTLHVLMMVVAMACSPIVLRVYEAEGRAAAAPFIRRQGELLLGLALPAAIAFIMLAPAITFALLGKEFQQAARALIPWIAAATVLSGFQAFYLSLAFSLPKRPLSQTSVLFAGALVNVALNFLLIPRFGLIGAALATAAAYALITAGSLLARPTTVPSTVLHERLLQDPDRVQRPRADLVARARQHRPASGDPAWPRWRHRLRDDRMRPRRRSVSPPLRSGAAAGLRVYAHCPGALLRSGDACGLGRATDVHAHGTPHHTDRS